MHIKLQLLKISIMYLFAVPTETPLDLRLRDVIDSRRRNKKRVSGFTFFIPRFAFISFQVAVSPEPLSVAITSAVPAEASSGPTPSCFPSFSLEKKEKPEMERNAGKRKLR